MQETSSRPRVQSLGREDPLEEGMATHFGILAWRISPWGHKESDTAAATEQEHERLSGTQL